MDRNLIVPKLSDALFTLERSADTNHVFLYANTNTPPFVGPKDGWKIVGWGNAPWAKGDSHFAVMFEKQTPTHEDFGISGGDMAEGTMIWHHFERKWLEENR